METDMTTKKKRRSYYKIISEAQLALRELRLEKGWSLPEAAAPLGIKSKAMGHIENGRVGLTDKRIRKILELWGLHYHDFIRAKKSVKVNKRNTPRRIIVRTVLTNKDRRSYKRIITKEVRVLRILRQIKKISQDKASYLCGYARPTIGHIENGRIELDSNRIKHILYCYGNTLEEFEIYMNEGIYREEISLHLSGVTLILIIRLFALLNLLIPSFAVLSRQKIPIGGMLTFHWI